MLCATKFFSKNKSSFYSKRGFSTETTSNNFDFDVFVIGGGSGGLALAKEAAQLGKKVGLCDFVKPSSQNTTWGLGGTCVNVGCIPKKLMHQSGILKETIDGVEPFGWTVENPKFSWERLVESTQLYIKSLNFGYKNDLYSNDVTYFNHLAKLNDNHTISLKNKKGVEKIIKAENIIVAVGGRPTLPDIEGSEHVITSDDIFSLPKNPGKTLVVGASYIALECAGFLHKFGIDTSVMVRSIVLRGFDIHMSGLIENHMRGEGVKFIGPSQPTKIEKLEDGRLKVYYSNLNNTISEEIYDTVLYAIGRKADTKLLDLENAGVKLNNNGKVVVDKEDRSTTPNIYAIGDCAEGVPELTPVAIRAGKLLARRLAGTSSETMNYRLIPTTVFTPIEYGTIGLPEEEARIIYGEKNIEVYHSYFQPLESVFNKKMESKCYVKIICNMLDDEKIVGFHLFSPNAAEITQGFATAMLLGAKKSDFERTIGIHPSIAEELTLLKTTKRENANPIKTGC